MKKAKDKTRGHKSFTCKNVGTVTYQDNCFVAMLTTACNRLETVTKKKQDFFLCQKAITYYGAYIEVVQFLESIGEEFPHSNFRSILISVQHLTYCIYQMFLHKTQTGQC